MKKMIIIDSNALVHRAFHAIPPLNTRKGELVNAVYGYLAILFKVIKEQKPDYIAATFDLAGPTFRHEQYKEYKATRVKAADELYQQINRVKDVLSVLNIPVYEKQGFEADDIIGTLTAKIKESKEKNYTLIVTGDLDTLQLVDENTGVYTLRRSIQDTIIYDIKGVEERFEGLKPEQMVDFKALKGDPSDNIPGVAGIGEKTAINLLKEFGNLDEIYENIGLIKANLSKKLSENKQQAYLSRELATINREVPIDFKLEDCRWGNFDKEKAVVLFNELEFFSLVKRLDEIGIFLEFSTEKNEEMAVSGMVKMEEEGRGAEIRKKINSLYEEGVFSEKVRDLEVSLVPVIEKMEKNGMKIDVDYFTSLSKDFEKKLAECEKKIHKIAGVSFNINSPQQLSEVLFERLGISKQGLKKTPGGVVSTAASELEKLKGRAEIIDLIVEFREMAKLKNSFIDTLPSFVGTDRRIHPQFDQLGTVTGRLSCSNPNLQNIPIRGQWGNIVRKAFVADNGYVLVSADYSQIDLRVIAHLADDQKMIEAFKEGRDIHIFTASQINGVPPEKVTPQMRYQAKALNFGLIYGMSVHGFAARAGVNREKAKEFMDNYMAEFEGIAFFIEETKKKAAVDGYVETLFGRKRFIPEINSRDFRLRSAAERMAVNMPVQGTSADIVKMAMTQIPANFKMVSQIHDELVFELPEKEAREMTDLVKNIMENICVLKMPLIVDTKMGKNWADMI